MHAWLITVGEPLPLPGSRRRLLRTGLLAGELLRRGHRVTWWTSRVDHYTKSRFPVAGPGVVLENGLEIVLLEGLLYRRNVSLARLVNHAQIARDFRRHAASRPSPDIVLCSWPTIGLSREACGFARRRGVPVLLDVRDLWPDLFADILPRPVAGVARALARPLFRDAGRILRSATGLLAISDGYLDWALARAGRARAAHDLVVPLGYPRHSLAPDTRRAAVAALAALGVDRTRPLAWFAGSFGHTYDLDLVIDAARILAARGRTDVQFVLSGAGERDAAWRRRAAGQPNVLFTGWLDGDELAAMLELATTGLAAYAPGAPQGLPNKLIEYLSGGLPVLSSLAGESAALLEEHGCGLSYDPASAESLADTVSRLLDQPGLRDAMSANAAAVYHRLFASEVVTDRLAGHLENVAAGGATPA